MVILMLSDTVTPRIFADELMEFFPSAKGVKRLAETSKKNNHRGVG
jgi:hypothetical protein